VVCCSPFQNIPDAFSEMDVFSVENYDRISLLSKPSIYFQEHDCESSLVLD
jgi:hypothetical protein